jgi:hypothetical protein
MESVLVEVSIFQIRMGNVSSAVKIAKHVPLNMIAKSASRIIIFTEPQK